MKYTVIDNEGAVIKEYQKLPYAKSFVDKHEGSKLMEDGKVIYENPIHNDETTEDLDVEQETCEEETSTEIPDEKEFAEETTDGEAEEDSTDDILSEEKIQSILDNIEKQKEKKSFLGKIKSIFKRD